MKINDFTTRFYKVYSSGYSASYKFKFFRNDLLFSQFRLETLNKIGFLNTIKSNNTFFKKIPNFLNNKKNINQLFNLYIVKN